MTFASNTTNSSDISDIVLNVDEELIIPPFDEDENYDEEDEYFEDEDEEENDIDRAAMAYLYRYEQMVRQQDSENHATSFHLQPLFERIRILGEGSDDEGDDHNFDDSNKELNSAVTNPTSSSRNKNTNTDPVSYNTLSMSTRNEISSIKYKVDDSESNGLHGEEKKEEQTEKQGYCEISNMLSYKAIKKALHVLQNTTPGKSEVLSTDSQLMMVLQELASSYETLESNSTSVNQDGEETTSGVQKALTYPEFLHCYKTVVNGMMILQMFPNSNNNEISNSSSSKYEDHKEGLLIPPEIQFQRARTKERTMSMLRTFYADFEKMETQRKNQLVTTLPSVQENEQYKDLFEEMVERIKESDQNLIQITNELNSYRDNSREENIQNKNIIGEKQGQNKLRFAIYFLIFSVAIVFLYTINLFSSFTVPMDSGNIFNVFSLKAQQSPSRLEADRKTHKKVILPEVFAELQEAHNEALTKISHLEKSKISQEKDHLKEIKAYTKHQSEYQSTITKLERDLDKSAKKLIETKEELAVYYDEMQNYTRSLDVCQSQVQLLEPDHELVEQTRHYLVQSHADRVRREERRSRLKSVLVGAGSVAMAPHVFTFLGSLGSATKIVSIVSGGTNVVEFAMHFPLLQKFPGLAGGAFKALRNVLKLI